jgi:hypothetical protein
MAQYLDDKYKASEISQDVQSELKFLARSFRAVGNDKVADQLVDAAFAIGQSQELYESSFNALFNNALSATRQATANMVQAALNVASQMKDHNSKPCSEISLGESKEGHVIQ